jgi:hypothetical protein
MPDLWDTNPDHVFGMPGEEPDSAPSGYDDHPEEVRLKDHSGNLRLPAYVVIALTDFQAADPIASALIRVGDSCLPGCRPAGPAHLAPAMPSATHPGGR